MEADKNEVIDRQVVTREEAEKIDSTSGSGLLVARITRDEKGNHMVNIASSCSITMFRAVVEAIEEDLKGTADPMKELLEKMIADLMNKE